MRAGIGIALDRRRASDLYWEQGARCGRSHFEVRNEQNELQRRRDRKALPRRAVRDIESAELRRRRVIRMSFQFGAKPEDFFARQAVFLRARLIRGSRPVARSRCCPDPRETGTSPAILNEKGKTPHLARAKKSSAAAQTMGWTGLRPPRRMVTSL